MFEYNSEAFTPEEVEKGSHLLLLNTLFQLDKNLETGYYDIHITSDGYCTIVEWCQVFPEISDAKFKFVGEQYQVMYEGCFPDNHTEMCLDEEDYNNRLKDWLKENPGWHRDEYGHWYNEKDVAELKDIYGLNN